MASSLKALHLRTADRGTDGTIAAWLRDHGVSVVDCADPFEACAVALTQSEPAPELAFVGVDWLDRDEMAILSYFRQVWPRVTIVLTGSAQATAGFHEAPLTRVCRSPAALQRVLASAPDALLAESLLAQQATKTVDRVGGWRPQPTTVPTQEPQTLSADETESHPAAHTQEADRFSADFAPRAAESGSRPPSERPAPHAHAILTPEELAALLEDDDP